MKNKFDYSKNCLSQKRDRTSLAIPDQPTLFWDRRYAFNKIMMIWPFSTTTIFIWGNNTENVPPENWLRTHFFGLGTHFFGLGTHHRIVMQNTPSWGSCIIWVGDSDICTGISVRIYPNSWWMSHFLSAVISKWIRHVDFTFG